MWTVLSEDEQQERFMQLKMRVQRLRKDGKLDGANSLPGAGLLYSSNLQALMGFSRMGEEIQRLEESKKIKQMEKDGKNLHCHRHHQPPTLIPFWQKRYPFFIPFIAKRYSFHILTCNSVL